jgi:hypothetical protein
MKSIHRSNLARALMTGAASLAVMMASAADARAEIVAVQGDDGAAGADGVILAILGCQAATASR